MDKQLIKEAQHQPSSEKKRQKNLTEIVNEVLRSRRICRTPKGESLYGVYQEIYQQAQQQLLQDVGQAIENSNVEFTSVREWAVILRDNAFRKVLTDARLQELAITAQQSEPETKERHYALSELIEAIRLSGRLSRPHSNKIPARFYSLIYEDAVNQTFLYIFQKIGTYDPKKGKTGSFITWVNFRLDKLVIETWQELLSFERLLAPEDLLKLPLAQNSPSLSEKTWECIEEDIDNVFQHEHIKKHPEANFQAIMLARRSGKSWRDISNEFGGIKVATLSNFFYRSCRKFALKFKEYF